MAKATQNQAAECPFCKPGERVLMGNDFANVFLSNPRKVAGHLLVTPKRHVEKPWELTNLELTAIFDLIFAIEQKLIGKLGDGFDVRQNYRPFMVQSKLKVNHVHFHVIPRSFEDYIYKVSEKYDTDLFADLDDMERDAVADMLK